MTRVCFVGKLDISLRDELFSRDTSRAALQTYTLSQPFANSIAVDTVSLGAAVALCNDLNWYLTRFVDTVLIKEPSISNNEWLSRLLATDVRDRKLPPEETDQYLTVYGVTENRLVEPMYVTRIDGSIPSYDLQDVEETVVVRVAKREFSH
ncbi:DUF5804 family protein [Natronocalculus amylovorans]|uniref:DUF5804 family protein n=1 Tax=Natronocalculus amylovorans TaxID=2917812 RepID=A0AAE3K8S0_9EURY|nr:DUF5804 family protein [Natronocalculus amylovorans]MCL9817333.1 DUF5804 family protein [Natronocalculus amylovorans]NUE02640.1 hypothetical protein [Halorubraceae archaeon YAN]